MGLGVVCSSSDQFGKAWRREWMRELRSCTIRGGGYSDHRVPVWRGLERGTIIVSLINCYYLVGRTVLSRLYVLCH